MKAEGGCENRWCDAAKYCLHWVLCEQQSWVGGPAGAAVIHLFGTHCIRKGPEKFSGKKDRVKQTTVLCVIDVGERE